MVHKIHRTIIQCGLAKKPNDFYLIRETLVTHAQNHPESLISSDRKTRRARTVNIRRNKPREKIVPRIEGGRKLERCDSWKKRWRNGRPRALDKRIRILKGGVGRRASRSWWPELDWITGARNARLKKTRRRSIRERISFRAVKLDTQRYVTARSMRPLSSART